VKSLPIHIAVVCVVALLLVGWPVELFTTAARPNPAARSAGAAQPEISSVQVLRHGQPEDYLIAGAQGRLYKLAVTGQGFDSSCKVLLNGKKIPTTVLSATQIIARPVGVELIPSELSLEVASRDDGNKSGVVIIDVVSDPSVLSISDISPTVAQVGASVTLNGVGFTPTGNRLRFVRAASPSLRGVTADLDSSDSSTLMFNVPDSVCADCPDAGPCPALCFALEPGEYLVAVENANGLSNSLDFLVSSATGPIGFWGGTGIAVRVTDTEVQIEGDCFSGLIPETLTTDANGNFNLSGTYQVFAGPVRQGQQGTPAQFSGSITGGAMVMSITVNSQFSLGPYTFTFGDYETIVHPCL
jgi:hypothetical protein